MYNRYTTALYAAVIASILVASFFAISFVQQALAQGNMTAGGGNMTAGGNKTAGGNMTGGAAGGANMTKTK